MEYLLLFIIVAIIYFVAIIYIEAKLYLILKNHKEQSLKLEEIINRIIKNEFIKQNLKGEEK